MAFTNVLPGSGKYPDLRLRWAPTTQPTDAAQTYTDITDHLREWDWGYGRADELTKFEAGTGHVLLNNRDRAFDPSYAAGTWFGNIKPRRMFELVAQWNAIQYPVFVAYSRGFPQAWPGEGFDGVVSIDLVDAFGMLQAVDLIVGFSRPAELSGDRIAAICDAVGIPSASRALDAGTVQVDAIEITTPGTSALDHAKSVAFDSEFGELFVAKDGKVTFHDWTRRLNPVSAATFGDAGVELPYTVDFSLQYDDTYVWNYIRATGASGEDASSVATDSASQDDYFPLTKTLPTQLTSGTDIDAIAQRYAVRYAQPQERAPALPVNGAKSPTALWPILLDLDVSDYITVKRRPFGGTVTTLPQFVEGIRHTCRPGGPWTTVIATSPADISTFGVADDAVLGKADSGNLAS